MTPVWTWIKRRWKAWATAVPPAAIILLNAIYDLGLTADQQLIIAGAATALLVERVPNAKE